MQVSGSSLIQCYAPATGEALGCINPSTTAGIDRAIATAEKAQQTWARTSFIQRRRVLRTMLQFILENQEVIARVACLDSGKTMVDASVGEILVTVEKLRWTIKHGEESLRPERRATNMLMMYKWNEVVWEPLGVVAACVSWNYPVRCEESIGILDIPLQDTQLTMSVSQPHQPHHILHLRWKRHHCQRL